MPEYQQDVKQRGAAMAFALWEKPARVIGYELLKRLLDQGANVLLEHSGVNSSHLQLHKNIKKYGYQTKVTFLMCDTDVAIERAKKREKMTGRHTPSKMIQERASLMGQYAVQYSKIADDIQFLDASGEQFHPIEFKY
ncbi:MAG: zeta toxin family protein [Alphaproteobacteria bacterium]|nr:zeta toxin family protein [Alphaproteobacteria bacterium]